MENSLTERKVLINIMNWLENMWTFIKILFFRMYKLFMLRMLLRSVLTFGAYGNFHLHKLMFKTPLLWTHWLPTYT